MSLRRRVVLVVVTLACLLVATSAAALVGHDRADDATARVTERAMPALVAVERLERAFVDEQTAIRGYVITGEDSLLEPYRSAAGVIAEQEAVLRAALADDPVVTRQLDVVLRANREWLDVSTSAIVLRAEGRQAELDQLISRSPGRPLFAALRAEAGELRAVIERRVAAESAHVAGIRAALTWMLVAAAAVGLLCAVLAVVGIRRSVTRPLAELVASVDRVSNGQLDRPVPTGGPPEFAVLGAAVDRMRTMLNSHRRSAVRTAGIEAEAREADRVGAELRDGAVRRLYEISRSLTALTKRHPALATDLARPIDELDRAIGEVRAAVAGVPAPGPDEPPALAARVADALARVPDLLGVHPDLRVENAPGQAVAEARIDELVAALDDALNDLVETRARLDGMEVELSVTARVAALSLTARGVVPEEWTSGARHRARRQDGTCRIVDLDPELTVVEWSVPVDR